MDWEVAERFLSNVGIPAGFAFGLLVMIWTALKAIAPYGHDAYERHAALVETLQESLKDQGRNAEEQLRQLERLSERTENSVVLRRVAIQAVTVLQKIAYRLELNVDHEISVMRQQLELQDREDSARRS